MAIEIRQLLIKSTVLQSGHSENISGDVTDAFERDAEALKQEVIADCRTLLREMIREQKER